MTIRILFEPRDLWIGVYWTRYQVGYMHILDVYICILPMLPILLHWSKRVDDDE